MVREYVEYDTNTLKFDNISFIANMWSFFKNAYIFSNTMYEKGFPSGSDGKESACNAGDLGSIFWVRKIPWRRKWLHPPVFLLGEFHGQRSLVDYSPWDRKELDTTERLTLPYTKKYEVYYNMVHINTHTMCSVFYSVLWYLFYSILLFHEN